MRMGLFTIINTILVHLNVPAKRCRDVLATLVIVVGFHGLDFSGSGKNRHR